MSKIQEALYTDAYGHRHYYLIVDEYPEHLYEQRGNLIYSNIDGFTSSYIKEPGTSNAFAGRQFEIPMKDGSKLQADGSIWSAGQSEAAGRPVTSIGLATKEMLNDCYVFMGAYIDTKILEKWLEDNPDKVSDNYWKYDKREQVAPTSN